LIRLCGSLSAISFWPFCGEMHPRALDAHGRGDRVDHLEQEPAAVLD
jgi:hypothetical protein